MNDSPPLRQLLSLSLFSAAGLALEITLTRLLSTLYYPPFIFAVLALAVLGIGIGAALTAIFPPLRKVERIPVWMIGAGISAMALAPVLTWLSTTSIDLILAVILTLPYIFIGLGVTTFFSTAPNHSRLLYAYDLIGAGLGAVGVVLLLNLFGALDGLLVVSVILLLAALIYLPSMMTIGVFFVGGAIVSMNIVTGMLDVAMSDLYAEKPIQEVLANGGEILETRWDAFARTDLVVPPDNQPYRLYVDGAAASVIPPAVNNDFLIADIGLFAFATAQPQTVFTIGGGGGLDAWFGLRVGAREITTVEANPQSVALTREYGTYNGNIYDLPNVRVLVDEGRSVLRREDRNYDLIFLSQVVTLTAERSGYALTENAVFTIEAFEDYWAHLTNEGYIALKLYDEPTLSRSLSIVMELLNRQGLTDQEALNHTITLLSPTTNPPTPMLIIRKTPFTRDEATVIGRTAQNLGFVSLFLPYVQADPPLDAVVAGVDTYQEIINRSSLDISTPTDNRPFFYQFENGIPEDLQPVLQFVGAVTIFGIVLLGGVGLRTGMSSFVPVSLYFAALGVGFIMIEITLIQYTRLFIGHPTLAVTSILATLLISGGLGSLWSQQLNLERYFWLPVLLAALMSLIWAIMWTWLSDAFRSNEIELRLLIVIVSIAPVGFFMGIPFATGLNRVANIDQRYVPLGWSINGVTTVVGSVGGVALSLVFGFQFVLIGGALAYGVALVATLFFSVSTN